MAHTVLIALHALAGVVCFAAGVLSLPLSTTASWRFRTYAIALAALLVFMAAVVALDWPDLDTGTRIVFLALSGLGGYMVWRVVHAKALLDRRGDQWRPRYLDDVGFTLIALFDGFAIIAALDLGAPGWLVALIAVAGVVVGHLTLRHVKARLSAAPASS
jgi:hypothetical protein